MHSSSNLEDGYIGSGKKLWNSVRKHGRENHIIEILEWYPDRSSLKEREKELVNEALLLDPMCLNLAIGGNGGFINSESAKAGAKGMNAKIWKDDEFRMRNSVRKSKMNEELHRKGVIQAPSWKGKTHTEETKRKIGEKNSLSQKGEKNSQFGKIWVKNELLKKSSKIEKQLLQEYLSNGWTLGRKFYKQ
jgi:hypothetical protein